MDLNVIVYEKVFANEKLIYSKIDRAINDGYKKIALSVVIMGDNIQNIPVPIMCKMKTQFSDVRILSRLTVKVDEIANFYHLSKHENLKYYDLLAIEPLNEKVLNYINNGYYDCDIMSFTFSESKLVNAIKKANFSLPISKGIGIEINYGDCLSSSSQRRQTIACGQMLVDKTNGKNIIMSSGTTSLVATGKSPRDVIYIGLLFGLNEFQGKYAIFKNGANVIKHSELRKNIVASAIEVMDDENHTEDGLDKIVENSSNSSSIKKREFEKAEEGTKKQKV